MMEPSHLRDLLNVRKDEDRLTHHSARREIVTLATVLTFDKNHVLTSSSSSSSSSSSTTRRTLVDIFRDDEVYPRNITVQLDSDSHRIMSWKSIRDRLLLRRATTAVLSHNFPNHFGPTPASSSRATVQTTTTTTSSTAMQWTGSSTVSVGEQQTETQRRRRQQEEPTGISLMALLDRTTNTLGGTEDYGDHNGTSTTTITAAMVGRSDHKVTSTSRERERDTYICCVCMVRHKGAAFIPCGHTFCRLCSRELWLSRGNCPLCNVYILEVLDIF